MSNELRRVEVLTKSGDAPAWLTVRMQELKVGDTFRMFEDETLVEWKGKTEFVVAKGPYLQDGVWGVGVDE